MTTAKGLAVSTGKPIVAIDTLDASAFPYLGLGVPVCSMISVGRGEVAAAAFRMNGDGVEKVVEDHVTTVESVTQAIDKPTIFCGPLNPDIESELTERLGGCALIPQTVSKVSHAVSMGEIGMRRIANGDVDDPVTLQPLYLRRPSITKPTRPPGG